MLLLSADGIVLAANRPARACTESVTPDPVGRHLADVVAESEHQVNRAVSSWLSSGLPSGHELSFRTSNGLTHRYRGEGMRVAQPGRDGQPAVLLRCVSGLPVTTTLADLNKQIDALHVEIESRASAAERLRQTQDRLLELQNMGPSAVSEAEVAAEKMEALGNLAGGIAHDFNNLLTVIRGEVELAMEDAGDDAELTESLSAVQVAAARAADLVASLLAFSRRQFVELAEFDLRDLVRASSSKVDQVLGDEVAAVVRQAEEPLTVVADWSQIQQVLSHLASNARDASGSDGHVWIRTRRATLSADFVAANRGSSQGEYAVLEVSDDGIGMPEDVRSRVFEPFFSTKAPGEGTGLGLAQVYGIVKSARGYVRIDSTEGEGTTVTVYLPLKEG